MAFEISDLRVAFFIPRTLIASCSGPRTPGSRPIGGGSPPRVTHARPNPLKRCKYKRSVQSYKGRMGRSARKLDDEPPRKRRTVGSGRIAVAFRGCRRGPAGGGRDRPTAGPLHCGATRSRDRRSPGGSDGITRRRVESVVILERWSRRRGTPQERLANDCIRLLSRAV